MPDRDPAAPLARFHGTWRLVGRRFTHADGKVTYPTGDNPRGFIMYSPRPGSGDVGYVGEKDNRGRGAPEDGKQSHRRPG